MYKNEIQILRMLKYIEEYANAVEDSGDRSQKEISVDSLNELINNYKNLRQKQTKDECTMWQVISPIVGLLTDDKSKSGVDSGAKREDLNKIPI